MNIMLTYTPPKTSVFGIQNYVVLSRWDERGKGARGVTLAPGALKLDPYELTHILFKVHHTDFLPVEFAPIAGCQSEKWHPAKLYVI